MRLFTVAKREKALKDDLKRVIEIIINKYNPEKIILFGSLVSGKMHEWSDIDLLIIKETKKRPIDRYLELCRLIKPKVGIDLFVYTPAEFEYLLKEKFSFLRNVLKTGKTIYERRD